MKDAYLVIKEDGETKAVKETVSAIQVGNDHLVANIHGRKDQYSESKCERAACGLEQDDG